VDNKVVPYPYGADFGLDDAVIKVTGEHDAVHPLTGQSQGQQIALRVHVERDVIQDLRRLARDVATRGRRADEGFHDHQQVHGEFVFFWGHLVLTSSELGGEQREQLPKTVDSGEGVRAIVVAEVCGDCLERLPDLGALESRAVAQCTSRHCRSSRAEEAGDNPRTAEK